MHTRRGFLGVALAFSLVGPGRAQGKFASLDGPRRHLIMRHALAPGFSDPGNFRVGDCTTQRNLNASGRVQAERTGQMLRDSGMAVERVYTSQWCRCRETAQLLDMGKPQDLTPLNSFFEARDRRAAQTLALQQALLGLAPDVSTMLVTHQVNLSALLGRSSQSGEVFAFEIKDDGTTTVLGSLLVPAV